MQNLMEVTADVNKVFRGEVAEVLIMVFTVLQLVLQHYNIGNTSFMS